MSQQPTLSKRSRQPYLITVIVFSFLLLFASGAVIGNLIAGETGAQIGAVALGVLSRMLPYGRWLEQLFPPEADR